MPHCSQFPYTYLLHIYILPPQKTLKFDTSALCFDFIEEFTLPKNYYTVSTSLLFILHIMLFHHFSNLWSLMHPLRWNWTILSLLQSFPNNSHKVNKKLYWLLKPFYLSAITWHILWLHAIIVFVYENLVCKKYTDIFLYFSITYNKIFQKYRNIRRT